MTQSDFERRVFDLLSRVLKTDLSHQSSRDNTPNWDSLGHIEVVLGLEEEFGVSFDEDQIGQLDSVRAIVQAVEDRSAP